MSRVRAPVTAASCSMVATGEVRRSLGRGRRNIPLVLHGTGQDAARPWRSTVVCFGSGIAFAAIPVRRLAAHAGATDREGLADPVRIPLSLRTPQMGLNPLIHLTVRPGDGIRRDPSAPWRPASPFETADCRARQARALADSQGPEQFLEGNLTGSVPDVPHRRTRDLYAC